MDSNEALSYLLCHLNSKDISKNKLKLLALQDLKKHERQIQSV